MLNLYKRLKSYNLINNMLTTSKPVDYDLVSEISSISSNNELQGYAGKQGLQILDITWEDTGRSKNSCWGPNISDMTLLLDKQSSLLPVIRFPNFSDKTADLSIEQFEISVGNEKGDTPTKIPLKKYLQNPAEFIKSDNKLESLFDESRDKEILVAAQYCVLPLEEGTCEFNVHLYNYQSNSEEPAVLVLVASSQGTSAQILSGNNPLYFNDDGKACNFLAERMKDVRKREGESEAKEMTKEEEEKNCLYIFQIPLKQKKQQRKEINCFSEGVKCKKKGKAKKKGMDDAILSKGKSHSNFKGINNKELERDKTFPIRCTLQFYKVTDTNEIPEAIFEDMAKKIDNVYTKGINQGSLVTEGFTGRSTEWVDKK